MKSILAHFKKLDWILIGSALLLTGFGLLSIYSSSSPQDHFFNFKKQIIFLALGFVSMLVISFFDWRIFSDNPYLVLALYFGCLLGLGGLFFFAPSIRGVKSWYRIGSISIDPIELTKVVLIILLAKYFSFRHAQMYYMRHILLSGVYILLPAVLIFFQPDLGSVLILGTTWVGILIISGIRVQHFFILVLCGFLVLSLSWLFLLKDYQKQRIVNFLVPKLDPLGAGWSRTQSQIAIGSGGILGKGIGKGPQTQYGFLPEPQTDFIFAAIAEETGLVGVAILFIFIIIFIWRVIQTAFVSGNNFCRLFASGFCILLVSQIFVNIGMSLGILPIIGISLPLVSYGGSNLIMTFVGLGILQSIRARD